MQCIQSASLVTGEMLIETTVRYPSCSLGWLWFFVFVFLKDHSVCKNMEKLLNDAVTLQHSLAVLKMLNIYLLYIPVILLLDIYQRGIKTIYQ